MSELKTYTMGVMCRRGKGGREVWTALSRYVNPEWDGFVGWCKRAFDQAKAARATSEDAM